MRDLALACIWQMIIDRDHADGAPLKRLHPTPNMPTGDESESQRHPAVRRIGPNDPCLCGSGRKFKKCCLPEARAFARAHAERARRAQFEEKPPIQLLWKGARIRGVGNTVWFREPTETFHEFLISSLQITFEETWWKGQLVLPPEKQHVVIRWYFAWCDLTHRLLPDNHQSGQVVIGHPTGETKALMDLADDLYRLQHECKLPEKVLNRLRSHDQFQGARYELAIAATFVRSGFKIEWNTDISQKGCEFVARHPATGDSIAVETKSRHRPGVLHHPSPGEPPDPATFKAKFGSLFRQALEQNQGSDPFAVFIDLNLPPSALGPDGTPLWGTEVKGFLEQYRGKNGKTAEFALLGFTNFAWHYLGQSEVRGLPNSLVFVPPSSSRQLLRAETVTALCSALSRYGTVRHDE